MRGIYIILLLLVGLLFWYLANNCNCCVVDGKNSTAVVAPIEKLPIKKLSPISFACSDDTPQLEARWTKFRDSLQNSLQENQILQIEGFEFGDETNSSTSKSLAMARAQQVRGLLDLQDNQVRLVSSNKADNCREEELYNLIRFRMLRNSAKIKEVGDRTLIYFPSNSTDKLGDAEIEAYLDDVAARVVKSGEKVQLIGHTDSTGDRIKNIQLGQGRANVIRDYLVSKGVSADAVIPTSQGPDQPIADNATAEGRAQNRRTELKIIN